MSGTVAIIQARMGSTRLPGKVLKKIGDLPMLWHVYERTNCASFLNKIVVVTSTESQDNVIADFCADHDIQYYRGSETDVLDRYYQTASNIDADTVVRLTADCPFLDPATVNRVVRAYQESSAEYVTNTFEYTYPDGLDVEVFGVPTLKTAWEEASTSEEREHVTTWIRNSGTVDTENVRNPIDIETYEFAKSDTIPRWSVDYPEDLEFVRKVYTRLTNRGHWLFGQSSILELLEKNPQLCCINRDL